MTRRQLTAIEAAQAKERRKRIQRHRYREEAERPYRSNREMMIEEERNDPDLLRMEIPLSGFDEPVAADEAFCRLLKQTQISRSVEKSYWNKLARYMDQG